MDSDAGILRVLQALLARFGVACVLAASATEALYMTQLARVAGSPFEIVITDADTRDGSGFDLARSLSAEGLAPEHFLFTTTVSTEDKIQTAGTLGGALFDKTELQELAVVAAALIGMEK